MFDDQDLAFQDYFKNNSQKIGPPNFHDVTRVSSTSEKPNGSLPKEWRKALRSAIVDLLGMEFTSFVNLKISSVIDYSSAPPPPPPPPIR